MQGQKAPESKDKLYPEVGFSLRGLGLPFFLVHWSSLLKPLCSVLSQLRLVSRANGNSNGGECFFFLGLEIMT